MRVAVRTDASGRIGTGHFRRCQALASALRALGTQVLFVSRRHDDTSEGTARGESVAWLAAPAPGFQPAAGDPAHADWAALAWDRDAEETAACLRDWHPDWILVDHYAFDARWHTRVAQATGARIAVIDDLADRPLAAALLLDQNLQPEAGDKYAGRLEAPAKVLLGPRFALLAPVYATAPRHRFRRRVHSIGVFISGGSAASLAATALQACRVAGFDGDVELVTASGSPQRAELEAAARRWPPARVTTDLPDLAGFFARHDLQIGSGGGAAWERCCVGVPTVAVQIADNQLAVLPHLARLGAVAWAAPADLATLAATVRHLLAQPRARLAMVRAGRRLVDGRGAARVAAVMHQAFAPGVRLRPARPDDEALLLAWANDPEVRRHAFQPRTILAAEHARWFRQRLADSAHCRIQVAEAGNGIPVGQVRFDRRPQAWEVDYSLDPAFRGLGVARAMLEAALRELAAAAGGPARVRGLVKPGNPASLRVFRSLGFDETLVQHDATPCHALTLDLAALR